MTRERFGEIMGDYCDEARIERLWLSGPADLKKAITEEVLRATVEFLAKAPPNASTGGSE